MSMARHYEFGVVSVGRARLTEGFTAMRTEVIVERIGGPTREEFTLLIDGEPEGQELEEAVEESLTRRAATLSARPEEHPLVGRVFGVDV
jgi:hypothetical protein